MLIRGARLLDGRRVDVRLGGGAIASITPASSRPPRSRARAPRRSSRAGDAASELAAADGLLLPGLHDHHLHLLAWAAALDSVACGPPDVCDADRLARALVDAASAARLPDGGAADGWVRGVGYHESVAGELDRRALDRWVEDVPLRIQHRSGACWILNSAAARRLRLDDGVDAPGVERDPDGRATGRLFRLDDWLRDRLSETASTTGASRPAPGLGRVGARLSAFGVTGVTDATPSNDARSLEILARAQTSGALPHRVLAMGGADLPAAAGPLRGPTPGAWKIVLDERALPSPDDLAVTIEKAHAEGRCVAIHCVTRSELVLAATAFRTARARPGDRLEHASVAPPDVVDLVARLPLTVVTQPGFVHSRGDVYRRDVDARDRAWLYRCRAWLEAGVPLAAGTDAPFGDPDPWRAMQAAVDRRTREGARLGAAEALSPERALALFLTPAETPGGPPRRVAVGRPADLCLLECGWERAREDLSRAKVAATWVAGRLVWRSAEGAVARG